MVPCIQPLIKLRQDTLFTYMQVINLDIWRLIAHLIKENKIERTTTTWQDLSSVLPRQAMAQPQY